MHKTKWITMAAALTLSATMAVAAPHGGGKAGGHGRGHRGAFLGGRLAEKLNLTDAQKTQIRAIQKGFRDQHQAAFERSRELRQQFREAKKANDTARLESLGPALQAQRTQMRQLGEALQAQIVAVLTPEQRAQLETLKAERKQRRGNRE